MKRYLLILLTIFAFVSCAKKEEGFVINGELANTSEGMIYLKSFRNKMFFNVDSTQIVNGKFTFKGKVDMPSLYGLQTEDMQYPIQFFVENASMTVKIADDLEAVTITNSPANDLYLGNAEAVLEDNYNIDSLVTANTTSPVAAFFLYRYFTYRVPLDQLKTIRAKFAPELNATPYLQDLDKIIATLENIQIGKVAPEFALPDTAGVSVSLSSFRGKYVLLDFWASWCPPCRRENPNVVATYNRFKDKNFTVVGISLDEDKSKWLQAISDDNLTWTHLSDLKYWDSEVAELYGVRAIPSNVLLDPEGVIIAKDIREEALPATLEKLLK